MGARRPNFGSDASARHSAPIVGWPSPIACAPGEGARLLSRQPCSLTHLRDLTTRCLPDLRLRRVRKWLLGSQPHIYIRFSLSYSLCAKCHLFHRVNVASRLFTCLRIKKKFFLNFIFCLRLEALEIRKNMRLSDEKNALEQLGTPKDLVFGGFLDFWIFGFLDFWICVDKLCKKCFLYTFSF